MMMFKVKSMSGVKVTEWDMSRKCMGVNGESLKKKALVSRTKPSLASFGALCTAQDSLTGEVRSSSVWGQQKGMCVRVRS